MTARCILALIVLAPLAGCAGSAPRSIEAPPALTGSMLAQIGGEFGSILDTGEDAEERFAAHAGASHAAPTPDHQEPR